MIPDNRPDWNTYFINIANEISKRATCLRRKYGAVIVNDNIIISTGYNGAPRGEANCICTGVCERERLNVPKGQNYELCVAVHAEQNAIINADPVRMRGSTIYIAGTNADGTFASGKPCLLCKRMIKNAMISKVIYRNENGDIITIKPYQILGDMPKSEKPRPPIPKVKDKSDSNKNTYLSEEDIWGDDTKDKNEETTNNGKSYSTQALYKQLEWDW